ncbi:hypothetical protein GIB67_028028 [Kingdonia uniflora]|uniref:Uncharacterized protein n=1 Tax=Kingdonia uniflora TaxID=39325 RepID=A0A7J7NE08_9MAGN|nr:hypothetical protein GIB67_028028 [Kingdonia uniflora]
MLVTTSYPRSWVQSLVLENSAQKDPNFKDFGYDSKYFIKAVKIARPSTSAPPSKSNLRFVHVWWFVFSFLEVEQLPQFRHLQQWLGLSVAGAIELGHIVDRPVIHTATSIIPLGWSDVASEKKNGDPLKVDITGYGLHLCTLVQAQVNGNWYCLDLFTTVFDFFQS